MRLKGKVALVTGAALKRSIGWGIAEALAKEGADVVVNDVAHLGELKARVDDLQTLGVRGLATPADVTQPDAVDAMIAQAVGEFGRLDILASNAGIIRWEHFMEITPKNFRDIVNVNIKGNVNVCKAAAHQMIEQGEGGRIIVTSSVQASRHFPITPVYGGTKRAMHNLVGALAIEFAPHNITVNHIGPGWVESPLNDIAPQLQSSQDVDETVSSIPLRRAGLIQEMGRAVVYFASEDGAYTTGAFLCVDGGLGISKYSY